MKLADQLHIILDEAGPKRGDTVEFKIDGKVQSGKFIKKIPKNKLLVKLNSGEEIEFDKDLLIIKLPKGGVDPKGKK